MLRRFAQVPGLLMIRNFVSEAEQPAVLASVARLRQLIALSIGSAQEVPLDWDSANAVRTAMKVKSTAHNLPTPEFYQTVRIARQNDTLDLLSDNFSSPSGSIISGMLQAECFEKYGEDGHVLTYFRLNKNLPAVGRMLAHRLISRLPGLLKQNETTLFNLLNKPNWTDRRWKMTLNFYDDVGSKRAGFPFHTDLPANGQSSFILGFQSSATIEFKRNDSEANKDVVLSHTLLPGELVVLSGDVRWNWMHRVLPTAKDAVDGLLFSPRSSIVLGCDY
jgi:hypothetical protein